MSNLYYWSGYDTKNQHRHGVSTLKNSFPKGIVVSETQRIPINAHIRKQALQWLKQLLCLFQAHSQKESFTLLTQSIEPLLAALTETIHAYLSQGLLLNEALRQLPTLFDKKVCDWIQIGEQSGTICKLGLCAIEATIRRKSIKKTIYQQLTYPTLIFASSLLLAVIMLTTLIPSMQDVYLDMNQAIPPLIHLALSFRAHLSIIGFTMASLVMISALFLLTPFSKPIVHSLLMRSKHYQEHVLGEWLMLLSECLNASISLQKSILYTQPSLPKTWHNHLNYLVTSLQQGELLSKALSQFPASSVMLCESIRIAESNHTLPETLSTMAAELHQSLHDKRERFIALLQPCLMAVIALFIGSLFYLMYQPMLGIGL